MKLACIVGVISELPLIVEVGLFVLVIELEDVTEFMVEKDNEGDPDKLYVPESDIVARSLGFAMPVIEADVEYDCMTLFVEETEAEGDVDSVSENELRGLPDSDSLADSEREG